MPKQMDRKFGVIPEWAKNGPISLRNYDFRAEAHCAQQNAKRQGEHPAVTLDSAEGRLWRQYFETHLGGLPLCMRMLITGKIANMTVPEPVPMWFDPSFEPSKGYVSPEYVERGSRTILSPPIPEGQDYHSLVARAQRRRA